METKTRRCKKGILGAKTLRNERYDDGRKKNAMYGLEDKVEDLSQKHKDKGQQLEKSRRKETNRKLQKIQHMNNKDQKGYNKEIRAHKEIIQESFAELKDPRTPTSVPPKEHWG